MVQKPEWFGISDPTLAPRITFLLVGVWWLGFSQITYRRLPNNIYNQTPEKDFIWKGLKELKIVLKELVVYPQLKYFLVAFFCFSVGVQTIVLMAGIFGSKELGLPTSNLIFTIILVQLVAIVGAYLFSNEGDRHKYEENLEEENKMKAQRTSDESSNKSLDLMKKLNDYLKY